MPRLVRKAPLKDRLLAYLDPWDFLLWLSEKLNDDAYDELLKDWATPLGVCMNILFILARGTSNLGRARGGDDVFGDLDARNGSGWLSWFSAALVQALTLFCCWNAFYTFFRKRHYRLFEHAVDDAPPTPSAHRVRVDSSPLSSSPLRYLQSVLSTATATSRAYPDAEREVWELSVWDPKPFHLTLFTLFSPGHLLLYYFSLPTASLDPRPSVTLLRTILFSILLSCQLGFLKSSFSQQAKDSALIHGEVMNEYDTKFVHPSLNRPVRDVGIQTRESAMTPRGTRTREVDIYTPTTIVNRGFRTNPNPNYAGQYDPDKLGSRHDPRRTSDVGLQRSVTTPSLVTPSIAQTYSTGYTQTPYSRQSFGAADYSSPLKAHHERSHERTPLRRDGGSLGVYTHANSPLRKAASSSHLTAGQDGSQNRAAGSPLKRVSTPGEGLQSKRHSGRI